MTGRIIHEWFLNTRGIASVVFLVGDIWNGCILSFHAHTGCSRHGSYLFHCSLGRSLGHRPGRSPRSGERPSSKTQQREISCSLSEIDKGIHSTVTFGNDFASLSTNCDVKSNFLSSIISWFDIEGKVCAVSDKSRHTSKFSPWQIFLNKLYLLVWMGKYAKIFLDTLLKS